MNNQPARRRRHTPVERARLLAEFQQSELTQKEFASRNGLSMSCLSIWLRKSRTEDHHSLPKAAFLRLPIDLPSPERSAPTYKIGLPDGHSIELSTGFQVDELKQICQLLRSL